MLLGRCRIERGEATALEAHALSNAVEAGHHRLRDRQLHNSVFIEQADFVNGDVRQRIRRHGSSEKLVSNGRYQLKGVHVTGVCREQQRGGLPCAPTS